MSFQPVLIRIPSMFTFCQGWDEMGPIGFFASILPGKSTIPAGNGFDVDPAAARGAKVCAVATSAAETARAFTVFSIKQVFGWSDAAPRSKGSCYRSSENAICHLEFHLTQR